MSAILLWSRKKKRPGLATRMCTADNRHLAAFFRPFHLCTPMGGSGGDTFGYAGFRMLRFANPTICCPPVWRRGQLINCTRRSPCQIPPAHLHPAHQHPAKARQRRPPRAQCAPGLSLMMRHRPSRRPNKACSGLFGRWTIAAKGSSLGPQQRKQCGARVVARRPYGSFREVQHENDDDIGSSKCIR
jgi:hypothetical protein